MRIICKKSPFPSPPRRRGNKFQFPKSTKSEVMSKLETSYKLSVSIMNRPNLFRKYTKSKSTHREMDALLLALGQKSG